MWDLKEAAGKALARRTEIAWEAAMPDKKANKPGGRGTPESFCCLGACETLKGNR